ncbi:MAG: hypothetical protein CO189_08165 [candidate division Zixibacteria bacterium CG_4_9_14_3_um_filter_46_8]|nr:MAG: hypothetical protein CO189_08165 [candidate division Zixibacteria bacterium CG_4_9_14_3_um_filter_46_8]
MRRGRQNIDDSYYPLFVTTGIVDRLRVFTDDTINSESLKSIEFARNKYDITLYAYVLMPSHIHMLCCSEEMGGVSRFMNSWKSWMAKRIMEYYQSDPGIFHKFKDAVMRFDLESKQNCKVWSSRFDDVAIRNEEMLNQKLNYIHENPVRAGLARNTIEYRYSSAGFYEHGESGIIKLMNIYEP